MYDWCAGDAQEHRIAAGIGRVYEAGYSCDIYNSFLGSQWILKISNIDIDIENI